MPNYVHSSLTIVGNKKDLIKFKTFAQSQVNCYTGAKELNVLDTQNFIPYPKKYLDLDIKPKTKIETNEFGQKFSIRGTDGFNSGGYDWCVKNWGSKWGISEPELNVDENEKGAEYTNSEAPDKGSRLIYSFQTAWSPISPVIKKMSVLFPKLEFSYFCNEESNAFVFQAEYKKGKLTGEEDLREYEDD